MPPVQPIGVAVFAVTYLLIASRRLSWLPLDRPAAALVGAVAAVALGALTPDEALRAVDLGTLLLLLGVMGMGAFLAADGVLDAAVPWLVRWGRSPRGLLGLVVWTSGGLAALITNDAVAVLGAPLVLRLARAQGLPPLPYLLALATACNTGSVATLVGNPQNMLCAALGDLSYRDHLLVMGPVALVSLAINHAWLAWVFRADLPDAPLRALPAAPLGATGALTLAVVAATTAGFLLDADLPFTAAAGFVALLVLHRRDTRPVWGHIDGPLLLFFAGLFIVVDALVRSGATAAALTRWPLTGLLTPDAQGLSFAFLVGSNVVSNVPFILVVREAMATLPRPDVAWELLAMASTFAGNLTLLGSVANLIVAEAARDHGGVGFWDHLRVGGPLALVTTAVGTAMTVWALGAPVG